jgi:pseudaminic acid cytidylyltransferase
LRDYFCVIPARGGSKRIPKKNIQEVGGIPLIGHVIRNALDSKAFNRVYVSTDSEEIASLAREFGACVPELRESNLSDDLTPTRPVIANFISKTPELQRENSVVACFYPFAALVAQEIIRAAIQRFEALPDDSKYLVAIRKYPHPIQRSFSLTTEGKLFFNDPRMIESRTQDLQEHYHDAGQFYFALASTWAVNAPILQNSYGFELSRFSVVDIDEWEDLEELRRIFDSKNLR